MIKTVTDTDNRRKDHFLQVSGAVKGMDEKTIRDLTSQASHT
jgi:hypothetical protein